VAEPKYFATPAEWRAWLDDNHAKAKELLVGFHKRGTKKASITWPESVDEALCFGWIDGVRRRLGDEAYTIRFTPRKKTSIWSAVNVARIAELKKAGKMHASGLEAFSHRTEARTGVYSFERHAAAKLTPAEEKKLRANAKASKWLDAQAPWYKRAVLHWVTSAKREETREERLATLIADCAAGQRIKPMRVSRKE